MINFRYHLVSIAAVFLALAIGVLVGYGVLDKPTINALQNRIDVVRNRADEERVANDQLRDELEQIEAAVGASAEFAVTGRLTGIPVVVVAVRDVDEEVAQATVQLSRRAGANAPGIIWLEPKWALNENGDAAALAKAIGVDIERDSSLRDAGYRALARRLASGAAADSDLLAALAAEGFVSLEPVDTDVFNAGSVIAGTRVLLADGSGMSTTPKAVVGPMASAASAAGMALVVAEVNDGDSERGSLLAPVIGNEQLSKVVSTVDDLDRPEGRLAGVLALADLGRNVVGHYGFGDGATSSLPPWWQL